MNRTSVSIDLVNERDQFEGRDFRIQPHHLKGFGSLKNRAETNLQAIQLLKKIEGENRPATHEEQEVLVQYSGWGAVPQIFQYYSRYDNGEWATLSRLCRSVLTDEEFTQIQASVNNAHFTSSEVIRAMYRAITETNLVPSDSFILEPGAGIGNFAGLLPSQYHLSQFAAVEIDSISARIMKFLYPSTKVFH